MQATASGAIIPKFGGGYYVEVISCRNAQRSVPSEQNARPRVCAGAAIARLVRGVVSASSTEMG
jgi:hypothetical protein